MWIGTFNLLNFSKELGNKSAAYGIFTRRASPRSIRPSVSLFFHNFHPGGYNCPGSIHLSMTVSYSDEEIISAIKIGGFREAPYVKYMYLRFQSQVVNYVIKNNGSEEDAKDIYQDGVVALYENIKTGKYKGEGSLSSYLYSICRFMWLNKLKRKGIEKRVNEEARHEEFEESSLPRMIENEKEERILELFDQLGEQCREVLIYSIFYGYSMDEIYKKMGYENAQIARNKKYKCVKRLKKLLENREDIRQLLKGN